MRKKIIRITTIFLFLLSLKSCGYRGEGENFKNVLKGTWRLEEIKCFSTDYNSGEIIERYILPSALTVEMIFSARNFSYAVTEIASNKMLSCITSASGNYSIDFSTESKGNISYSGVLTSEGCSFEISDTSGAGLTTIPFGFSALSDDTVKLQWLIDNLGYLVIQTSSGFRGGTNQAYCSESCVCYGYFNS